MIPVMLCYFPFALMNYNLSLKNASYNTFPSS